MRGHPARETLSPLDGADTAEHVEDLDHRIGRVARGHQLVTGAHVSRTLRQRLDDQEFRDQLCSYIDVVIGWNREVSEIDSWGMIAVRRLIAIPLYSAARFAVRRRHFGPRHRTS